MNILITTNPNVLNNTAPGDQISFTVVYNNDVGDETTTGLGLRIHFNSQELQNLVFTDAFPQDLQVFNKVVLDDVQNTDGDANTDQFIQFDWASFGSNFPGVGNLPQDLVTLTFDVGQAFDGEVVNFSAASLPNGFGFTPTSLAINAGLLVRDDAVTTDEDNAVAGDVLANDAGGQGALTVAAVNGAAGDVGSAVTLASGARLTVNSDGTFNYDPTGAFDGLAVGASDTDSFTYTATDTAGSTNDATVTVTVNGVNDAPVAVADAIAGTEDAAAAGNVLANDQDLDQGDVLTVVAVNGEAGDVGQQLTLASGALLTVGADGSVAFDPNGGFETLGVGASATEAFQYTVSDGNGGTSTATATITIAGANDAPVAADDAVATTEDASVTGAVLGNDADVDQGDVLTVAAVNGQVGDVGSQVTLASGAVVTMNADGTFDYDPNGQFEALAVGASAADSFTYLVQDGNGSTDTGTVNLTVNGVNDAPDAVDDAITTDEDTSATGSLVANDQDVDGDTLVISAVNGQAGDVGSALTLGSGAVLTVNADGTFDFDPNGQFEGLAAGASATDSFTYAISDGNGGTDTATATVTITGVNDAPDAVDDVAAVVESGTVTGSVLSNDVDVDLGDTLTVTAVNGVAAAVGNVVVLPTGASVVLNADGTFSYDASTSDVFDALGRDATLADTFTYSISDGNGGADTATVNVTVTGENDAPVATDDAFVTDEATQISGDVIANDLDVDSDPLTVSAVNGAGAGVGNQVTLTSGALLTLNADGSFDYDPNGQFENLGAGQSATDSFTYTASDPDGATDTATASVTINGVNDAPDAVDDTFSIAQNGLFTGDLIANDIDIDGDALSLIAFGNNDLTGGLSVFVNDDGSEFNFSANGTFTFDPKNAFDDLGQGETRDVNFTYTISDGNGGTDTANATITVNGQNEPPVTVDDALATTEDAAITGNVLANDDDPEGDALTVAAVNGAAGNVATQIVLNSGALLTINANGDVSLDPNGALEALGTGDTRVETVTYTASDGFGGFDDGTLTVTINGVNDAPVAGADAFQTTEDDVLSGSLLGNDVDAEGDVLVVAAVNGVAASVGSQITLASGALLTVNADGTFSYDPNAQFELLRAGERQDDSFDYTVADPEGAADTATATITIQGVDEPIITTNGSAGEDLLAVDNGRDSLTGEAGDDTLAGGAGDDLLDGGTENDILIGQERATAIFDGSHQDFEITAMNARDVELFNRLLAVDGQALSATDPAFLVSDGNVADGDAGEDRVQVGALQFDDRTFQISDQGRLTLSGDADRFNGGNRGEAVDGGAGSDSLNGGFGNDLLLDSSGADLLDGGAGIDLLVARHSDGATVGFTGGADADVFQLRELDGNGLSLTLNINDFQDGSDLIDLGQLRAADGQGLAFADLLISANGGDAVIDLSNLTTADGNQTAGQIVVTGAAGEMDVGDFSLDGSGLPTGLADFDQFFGSTEQVG
ncbi:MAG: Ig-like domain-containing protein [Minwuia sp.]|nr:Ig-like domain-containing protein [Minwuia sp.]